MGVKLGVPKTVEIEAEEIRLHLKLCDEFSAALFDITGEEIGKYEGYVPKFFPGEHFGDYLILNINIETGQITNWDAPTASQLADTFFPTDNTED